MEGIEPNTNARDVSGPGSPDGPIPGPIPCRDAVEMCAPAGRDSSSGDKLGPARGLVVGVAIGVTIWGVLIAAAVFLSR